MQRREICNHIRFLDEPAPHSDGIRVGVVYCQSHQTHEKEFFSNCTTLHIRNNSASLPNFILLTPSILVETSEDFEQFLQMLGEKIELKGWPHHGGGLDTQSILIYSFSYAIPSFLIL